MEPRDDDTTPRRCSPSDACWGLIVLLTAAGLVACQGISTGPGEGRGDVDLWDVEVDVAPNPSDGSSDSGRDTSGSDGGDATSPPRPNPDPDDVPACPEAWSTYLTDRADGAERSDTDAYAAPATDRRRALGAGIEAAMQNRWQAAADALDRAGYEICRGRDRHGDLLVWYPAAKQNAWARLALRLERDARPVYLQVPHPVTESGVADQTISLFTRSRARAVLVAGTHRCANRSYTPCDGETDACGGGPSRFRNSDMGHTPETFFQFFHDRAATYFPETLVLSLHAFAGEGASLSNGTTGPVDRNSPVAALGRALETEFPDRTITYCNALPDRTQTNRRCGTTNLQGRELNGVSETCRQSASSASGRFLYLSQGPALQEAPSRANAALVEFITAR